MTHIRGGGRPGPAAPDAATRLEGPATRARGLPLAAHVVALLVGLALLAPLARPSVTTPDEGAYGIQAELVAQGRWSYESPLARLDPGGRWFPISHADRFGDRWYPYVKHPLVPATMGRFVDWLGRDVGLALFGLAGVVASAVAAWFVGRELDARAAPVAFWLAAASPLLVDGFIAGAHTWAAACAGAAALAALRLVRRGGALTAAALGVALAGGALVRSESVLWAGALLLAVLLVRGRRVGFRAALVTVSGPAMVVITAMVAERRWVASIVGGGAPSDLAVRTDPDGSGGTLGLQWLGGRFQGIWHSTLEGTLAQPALVRVVLPAAVIAMAVVVVRNRRGDRPIVELAVGATAALVALLWFAHPAGLVRGFVPASPAIVLGVVLALSARRRSTDEILLLGSSLLFLLALYATQYADGGAFQWGGRFLAPLVVPLAGVAALRLRDLVAGRPEPLRRALTGGLVALAVVMSVGGVSALGSGRDQASGLYADIAAASSPVNVTTAELLPRTMWREDMAWLRARPEGLGPLLDHLRHEGVRSVTVYTPLDASPVDAGGWAEVRRVDATGGLPLQVTVLRR